MTNTQILRNATNKAIINGWDKMGFNNTVSADYIIDHIEWYYLIFNHDFAKALWGDKENEFDEIIGYSMKLSRPVHIKAYEIHLQRMVLSKDPIKYLGENIGLDR